MITVFIVMWDRIQRLCWGGVADHVIPLYRHVQIYLSVLYMEPSSYCQAPGLHGCASRERSDIKYM